MCPIMVLIRWHENEGQYIERQNATCSTTAELKPELLNPRFGRKPRAAKPVLHLLDTLETVAL